MWKSSWSSIIFSKDYSHPIGFFGTFVKNHLAIHMRVNFGILNFDSLIYRSVLMSLPNQMLWELFPSHLAYYQMSYGLIQCQCSGMSLILLLWRCFASWWSLWPAYALVTLWHDGILGLQSWLIPFVFFIQNINL